MMEKLPHRTSPESSKMSDIDLMLPYLGIHIHTYQTMLPEGKLERGKLQKVL
jgi:hypothetical protein